MARAVEFARRMNRLAVRIEKNATERTNRLALAIQRELVVNTPVDTGQAISNWTLTLGSPNNDVYSPYAPGDKGSTKQLNIGAAYSQAMYAVGDRRPGQTIWISNPLSYIRLLNQGSSRQAPSGFVQTAVKVGVGSVKGVRIVK